MEVEICPYCKEPAEFVDSAKVYFKSYGMIYLCKNYPKCDALVGVHKGTEKPLGTMANRRLRDKRIYAHAFLDVLWKQRLMSRRAAYGLLASYLEIPRRECHIGMFTEEQCREVIRFVLKLNRELNNVEKESSSQKEEAIW